VDVKAFTGPVTEPTTQHRTETRNVHAVQPVTDRKDSDTPTPFTPGPSVSIGARDHPLQLLVRVVKQKLDDVLPHPDMPANSKPLEKKQSAFNGSFDIELSPELASKNILTYASTYYEIYKSTHKNKNEAAILNEFTNRLSDIIEMGFDEARVILQNLEVLHGTVRRDVEYSLVLIQKSLVNFRQTS